MPQNREVVPLGSNDLGTPVLVGIDAGASKTVAIAVTPDGVRLGRADGPGANPKRHGLEAAADRIASITREVAGGRAPDLLFVAGAGIDRPEHARTLETALRERLSAVRVIVVNDTLAVLRAATDDGVGLVIPVSTGGNVIGRAADGRVTDRGHGIFGGGYVLGALAARAARRRAAAHALRDPERILGADLVRESGSAFFEWLNDRRPGPTVAQLGAAVVRAAQDGYPYPARMVDRWCTHVTRATREEVDRLGLGPAPMVILYGGLLDASPWLGEHLRAAVLVAAPAARFRTLEVEPAEGAALLARDAWAGRPIGWDFSPRRPPAVRAPPPAPPGPVRTSASP
jgi:N-acetylglucosamine kinase-like BadF-type ATPase